MGRPPSNGGPSFRFNPTEVAEMEAILQAHKTQVPSREVLVALADKFSSSGDRAGKITVQMKQVWNWFQNRRYAIRAKASKNPVKSAPSPAPNLLQVPQYMSMSVTSSQAAVRNIPQALLPVSSPSAPNAGQITSDLMEYEARSARDGAWYDVATFISHRFVETTDPEVLVRFAGLGPEEDEWVNIRKHVRQRSLPCEASECAAVCPSDLILCFQEGKDQALYYDAHVLDAQRRRHDVRGCRCRFLVRYDHDQSEEIVPLKKVCRRPETDYRMLQLAESGNINSNKVSHEPQSGNNTVNPSSLLKAETKEQPKAEVQASTQPALPPIANSNSLLTTDAVANSVSAANPAFIATHVAQPTASVVTTTIPISQSTVCGATLPDVSTSNPAVSSSNLGAAVATVAMATVAKSITSGTTLSSKDSVAKAIVSEANFCIESAKSPAVDSGATLFPTGAQPTSGATPVAVSAANEAVLAFNSQATDPTNEGVQVSDSEVTAISVSESQATASGYETSSEAVPASDSLATASSTEAIPVIDSQAAYLMNEKDFLVDTSQAPASKNEAVSVDESQAPASMNEAVSAGKSQAPASVNEAAPVNDSQTAASVNEAVLVSNSQADISMSEAVSVDEAVLVSNSQADISMSEAVSVNEAVLVSSSQADISMSEAVSVNDSQADISMNGTVPVGVSMNETIPVSDSQADVSMDEAVPVSDSQADNVSMKEAAAVGDSQADFPMNEAAPVRDSQAAVSVSEAAAVNNSEADVSMDEAAPVSDSQAAVLVNAAAAINDSEADVSVNKSPPVNDSQPEVTISEGNSQPDISITEVVPVSDSQATAFINEAIPVNSNPIIPEETLSAAIATKPTVELVDSGEILPTESVIDSLNSVSESAASTTTQAMATTVTAITSGLPESPATQDANSSLSGSAVPNLSVAGATDAAVTTTVSSPIEAGASDSVLPATAVDSDDLAAGDDLSQVPK